MAYEKHPDEIGVLFAKESSKGTTYYTGNLNGQEVVGFPKTAKDGRQRIELRKSKPREGQQASGPQPSLYGDESVPPWDDLDKVPF